MKHAGKMLMEKRGEFHGINSYSFRTDQDEVVISTGYVCFAGVKDELKGVDGNVTHFFLATAHKNKLPHFKEYLKFLLTKSIFKDCYITKRVCDATRYGVSMDVTKPRNQMQAALIAVRRGWEYNKRIQAWADFVAAGISPHLALIVSYYVSKEEKGYMVNIRGFSSNHEVFGFDSFLQGVQALKNPLNNLSSPLSKEKKFTMDVFNTTNHESRGQALDWYVSNKIDYYSYLDFDKTVEKLKKIQKEHNV